MLSVAPVEALVKVQLVPKGPPQTAIEVVREYDTPQGRMQECRVDSSGMIYKCKVGARQVPRSGAVPERVLVQLETNVLPSKPGLSTAGFAGKPGGSAPEVAGNSCDAAPAPREALHPLQLNPAGSAQPADGAHVKAAAAQPVQHPAGSESSAAVEQPTQQQTPAASDACAPLQQQQQDVEMTDAAPAAVEAAEPTAAAEASAEAQPKGPTAAAAVAAATLPPKTPARSRLSMATSARHMPAAAAADTAAVVTGASTSGVTHEYIQGVLAQLPEGTLDERQARQVAIILNDEVGVTLTALQRPKAASGFGGAAALRAEPSMETGADAATRAEVAALLPLILRSPDFLAAVLKHTQPEAPVAAALTEALKRQAAQGAEEDMLTSDGYGLAGAKRVAAETAALQALRSAQMGEGARWDELKAQRLALTPERPPAAATGPLDDTTPGVPPAEAVAAARAAAHQQLTLQVEGLCALVEGATALLDSADLTSVRLQGAYEAAAFSELPHVDSPVTLIRRAIRPLPPPPTPAAEKAAREL